MTDTIIQMFSYSFMVRAVIVGILVSLCSALLGVSLVLKRYSMIGAGLSHVGFGALAMATALGISPMQVTIPVVVISAVLLLRVSETGKIKGDSAIGIISTSALAIGVLAISMTSGLNTDLYNYLFGSILAMTKNDVYLSICLSICVLVAFVIFYNKIFAVTFDESFARACGTSAKSYNMLIAVLTAITIVLGMRMMGSLIISALIIFPAITAMRLFRSFRSVTVSAAVISVVCFMISITLSYVYDLPTGATLVVAHLCILGISELFRKLFAKK